MAGFFLPLLILCCSWKEHRQKACKQNQLPNLIQRMLKRKVWQGGPNLRRGGGPYPLADLDREVQIRGGPNPLLHLHVVDAGFVWGLRKKLFYSCHQFEDGWIRNSWRGITTDQVRSRLEIGWFDVYSRTMLIHLPFSGYLRDLFFVLDQGARDLSWCFIHLTELKYRFIYNCHSIC